ncbi:hypothetical protein BDV98DRAFT_638496 [Pterulicium gracile]|uniref:Uncharacterized protein n=1 Tax=Pterulicium gracile TaxID=1884261 RepID=A0A5C3Q1W6_9AGAR|nr:hypothetical protein BDV98DRAFT_638496 [Pterula gracilis]
MSFANQRLLLNLRDTLTSTAAGSSVTFSSNWTVQNSDGNLCDWSGVDTCMPMLLFEGPPGTNYQTDNGTSQAEVLIRYPGSSMVEFQVSTVTLTDGNFRGQCYSWRMAYSLLDPKENNGGVAFALTNGEFQAHVRGPGFEDHAVAGGSEPADSSVSIGPMNVLLPDNCTLEAGRPPYQFAFLLNYVIFSLSVEDKIDQDKDLLIVDSQDEAFVEYKGPGWMFSRRTDTESQYLEDAAFRLRSADTSREGDSLQLSFVGTSVRVVYRGTNDVVILLDGETAQSHDVTRTVARFSGDPSFVYRAGGLDGERVHTVNITVTRIPLEVKSFLFLGFIYSPSFQSLQEGEALFANLTSADDVQPTTSSGEGDNTASGATGNTASLLAGPIAGSIGGFLLLLLVTLTVWRRRARSQREALGSDPLSESTKEPAPSNSSSSPGVSKLEKVKC